MVIDQNLVAYGNIKQPYAGEVTAGSASWKYFTSPECEAFTLISHETVVYSMEIRKNDLGGHVT
jgi:hypothetical protein